LTDFDAPGGHRNPQLAVDHHGRTTDAPPPSKPIRPAHILDLRARVRTRHLLSHQRTEWQQRMQAVLYHHADPHQRNLLTAEKRECKPEIKR
jgi:Ser/Thr protein kinase RdoA (MazF antagonist)